MTRRKNHQDNGTQYGFKFKTLKKWVPVIHKQNHHNCIYYFLWNHEDYGKYESMNYEDIFAIYTINNCRNCNVQQHQKNLNIVVPMVAFIFVTLFVCYLQVP